MKHPAAALVRYFSFPTFRQGLPALRKSPPGLLLAERIQLRQ